jgi:hypothetical protein
MSSMPEVDAGDIDAMAGEAAVVAVVAAALGASKNDAELGACPNCGATRTGHFCANCGQKAAPVAPTLGQLVRELVHEISNVDGKIFRTLRLLLTRPGFLTRETFAGRRASYILPLRLYLVASVLSFAFAAAFGGFDAVNIQYTPDPGETVDPAQVERMAEAERIATEALFVWLPRAMFVLVPLFAALVMLFRRKGGYTYPQHLYFALHVHAAWFFANAIEALAKAIPLPYVAPVAGTVIAVYMVVYFPVAFRRVYETTIWGTLWRTVTIGLLYFAVLMFTLLSIAAPLVWPVIFGESS